MNKAGIVSIIIALLLAAPVEVIGQEPAETQEPTETQAPASERSPVLAGALSGLLWPGLGSYYAGNSGHGTMHAAIAGVSFLGMIAGASNCEFNLFGESDDSGCGLAAASGVVFLGNWVWSIVSGVKDVNEYNRIHRVGLQVAPRVVALGSAKGPVVGVELVRFGL